MSDTDDRPVHEEQQPGDGDQIGRLLRLAGPRETVPFDRMLRVKSNVRAEWRLQTRARSRRVTIGWSLGALAAAALLLISLRLTVRDRPADAPSQTVATAEAVAGAVRLTTSFASGGAGPREFRVGDRIPEGHGVDTTSGGRAALRLATGISVRVDRGTRLRLISDSVLWLDEGAVYIDSGGGDGSLEVHTTRGVARDVGTRFEVRLDGSALRLRVRDGLVRLSHSRGSHEASRGDELTMDGNGSVGRRTVPVFGADWEWAATLARPFELEGRSLRDFLDWISEENGWQLRFSDLTVEEKAAATILHGSIQGLTPSEALAAVLPTSGLEHQLDHGALLVRPSAGGTKD